MNKKPSLIFEKYNLLFSQFNTFCDSYNKNIQSPNAIQGTAISNQDLNDPEVRSFKLLNRQCNVRFLTSDEHNAMEQGLPVYGYAIFELQHHKDPITLYAVKFDNLGNLRSDDLLGETTSNLGNCFNHIFSKVTNKLFQEIRFSNTNSKQSDQVSGTE